MMKINITLLRSGLLLLNCGALCLLGFTFYGLFTGSPEAVSVRLVDAKDYELSPQAVRPTGNQYQKIISDLYRQPPPVRTAPVKPEVNPDMPLMDGGPIGEWEITGVIVSSAAGQRFATIREKGQTSVLVPGRSTRTVTSSRVRGSSRTSSRGRSTRTAGRSSRAPVSNQRVRLLEQGKTVRIDENVFSVIEIDDAPRRVLYEHNGRRYTLSTEQKVDAIIHEEGSVLVLRGFSPEEIELLGGASARPGGATQTPAIPTDVRGSIKDQQGKAAPGTAERTTSATSGRATNGTLRTPPTSRPINTSTRGQLGGRSGRKPSTPTGRTAPKKPTGVRGSTSVTDEESRKQVEATLGIDLDDQQGTIRRLEELNRNQGQQSP